MIAEMLTVIFTLNHMIVSENKRYFNYSFV